MVTLDADGKVMPRKSMLYKTARVTAKLVDSLPVCPFYADVKPGAIVAVRFAWISEAGQPVYYFALHATDWLGVAAESALCDFCL